MGRSTADVVARYDSSREAAELGDGAGAAAAIGATIAMYERVLETHPAYAKNDLVLYQLARAYEGAVGGKANKWWIWITLCVLFLATGPRRIFFIGRLARRLRWFLRGGFRVSTLFLGVRLFRIGLFGAIVLRVRRGPHHQGAHAHCPNQ